MRTCILFFSLPIVLLCLSSFSLDSSSLHGFFISNSFVFCSKTHDQGNSQGKRVSWDLLFQRGDSRAQRAGSWGLKSLNCEQEAERVNSQSLLPATHLLPRGHASSDKATPPRASPNSMPASDHTFKCRSLGCACHSKHHSHYLLSHL